MPARATLLPHASLLYFELYDTVNPGDLWQTLNATYQRPEYTRGMAEVGDFRGVTDMQVGYDDMLTFTKAYNAFHTADPAPLNLFLLEQNWLGFCIAKMHIAFSRSINSPIKINVLPAFPEIFAALDLSDAQIAELPQHCRQESHLL